MPRRLDRRDFLTYTTAASLAGIGFHTFPLAANQNRSPNERLNIAAIGATGRAAANLQECRSQNIIAIADIDSNSLDKGAARFQHAHKYRDYRVMLEKEAPHIDAVLVAIPDHSHAPAAAMAMRLGKHVYCEKPLTHTVYEARTLANLARENKLITQMGTQIHAENNYRRVVELVERGTVGPIREVHVWANTSYTGGKFTTDKPCPAHLDWDLFLGPAPERAYSDGVHPFNWRRFWDYGSGTLGDFGCHYMDLAHWALKLRHPTSVHARGPELDPVSAPAWCIVEYEYPARGDLPPVKLTWYDSGKRPEVLATLHDKEGKKLDWKSGQLFVGEKGMLLSDYGRNVLLPVERFADYSRPEPYIPNSIGHHNEWLQAIRTGGTTTCNFDYSGALAEAVLLGTVSFRSGEKIIWDAEHLKVTNSDRAQQWIHKEYRKGWIL